jgi:uncharacterized protein YdiU (UPF0061 family)
MPIYEKKWLERMKPKLGLVGEDENDEALINQWLQYLEDEDLDFTLSFRALSESPENLKQTKKFDCFYSKWQRRLNDQSPSVQKYYALMDSVNPVFIPRNHQVERAIQVALKNDFSVFMEMNECFKKPYEEQVKFDAYKVAPLVVERIKATFCGT